MSPTAVLRSRVNQAAKVFMKPNKTHAAFVGLTFLLAVVLVPYSPLAADGNLVCNNTFGPTAITSGTYGNVVVPPGDNCVMYGQVSVIMIQGNIIVGKGSELHLFGGVIVAGDLQSVGAQHIAINQGTVAIANTIRGNVEIQNTADHVALISLVVGKNVEIRNTGNYLSLASLVVGGNVQIHNTEGLVLPTTVPVALSLTGNSLLGNVEIQNGMGGATINQNEILGNLDCQNIASPLTLGTNWVVGNASGQCE